MPPIAAAGCSDVMSALVLLRHGPTAWSATHRLQGRTDLPLSGHGRAVVESWRLPETVVPYVWMSSPLRRCRETAEILRRQCAPAGPLRVEPRLTEMSFGDWEGRTLAELRSMQGPALIELEGRGLDFGAPDGESPRDVQVRLKPWLQELDAHGDVLAITHKGVIRALYALASGWDMRGKPAHRLLDGRLHAFAVDRTGLRIESLNIPLRSDIPVAGTSA
jgi:probable phosphoglycerate mutase